MTLQPGARLGSYEILSPLGVGGMGEVYRARDTKLGRDVALKVLPDLFANDPERLARFQREAQVLASLNHPNIAHIHGLEESGGVHALVMELVEGDDLAARLARGALPLDEALPIAKQIVVALEAAHERGIIHRDLKPANIKVTPDGRVKVLDFGLAKTLSGPRQSDEATVTSMGTLQGVILGTAAYMSPQQARGQAVDVRTDVWAFGCVLYEMLTGHLAFGGATASDAIARIIEREPDWAALPPATPASLRRLLARCLEKDPNRRLHAIADAQFELDDAMAEIKSGSASRASRASAGVRRWIAAAGIASVIVVAGVWRFRQTPVEPLEAPRVSSLTSYPGNELTPSFSPDGRQLAFSWGGEQDDNEDIYVVIVGSDSPLRLTKDQARDISPAWKPDGSQIAFVRTNGQRAGIYVISPLGESEQRIAEFDTLNSDPTLSWSPDGRWLAISCIAEGKPNGVYLLAADGASGQPFFPPPSESAGFLDFPAFSPKGDAVAYVVRVFGASYVEVVGLTSTQPPALSGSPRRITDRIGAISGLAWTPNGKELIYGQGQVLYNAAHLWRVPVADGRLPERIDLAGVGASPAVPRSGGQLAFSRRSLNLDLLKLQEGRDPERFVASTFNEFGASFSPDGSKVAFTSDRTGEGTEIWVADSSDGAGRRSVTKGTHKPEGSPRWSPDGRRIVFDGVGEDGKQHVYVVDEAGGPVQPFAFKAGFSDNVPSWSHDGKWIYFGSARTGRAEVWRAPVAGGDAEQLTTTGGSTPLESPDGRTVYFSRLIAGPGTDLQGPGRDVIAIPSAGGPERRLGITATYWNMAPTDDGLYYVATRQGQKAPYTFEVRFLDLMTGKSRTLHTLRMALIAPGLSVSPDMRTILLSGVSEISYDLLRIENFR